MEQLRELVRIHGALATRAMLDEVIKQEQKILEQRLKEINLYMSEVQAEIGSPSVREASLLYMSGAQLEQSTINVIETKISSIEEKLTQRTPKAEQRAAEAAKRAELTQAGIDPRDRLTKENLQKWLAEGKTFSQIAREEVGLRQEEISAAAKKYGLKPEKESVKVTITKEA